MHERSPFYVCGWKTQSDQWKLFVISSRFKRYFITFYYLQCFLSIRPSWRIIPNLRRCQELCLNMWPLWVSCLVWWQRNLYWTCQRLNKISLVKTIIHLLYRQVICWGYHVLILSVAWNQVKLEVVLSQLKINEGHCRTSWQDDLQPRPAWKRGAWNWNSLCVDLL